MLNLMQVFFTCKNIYVFEEEKPEMDDFVEEKKFVSKGRTDTIGKVSKNIVPEQSKHFLYFEWRSLRMQGFFTCSLRRVRRTHSFDAHLFKKYIKIRTI